METSTENTTPAWIAALPGFDPNADDNNNLQLLGMTWRYWGINRRHGRHELSMFDFPDRICAIRQGVESFNWESTLIIRTGPSDQAPNDSNRQYIRAVGTANSAEAAARAATGFQHISREVAGRTWYRGEHCGRVTWEMQRAGKTFTVCETPEHNFFWTVPIDLTPLRAAGLTIYEDQQSGYSESPEDAMQAAMEALLALRMACRRFLADTTPQPEPELISFALDRAEEARAA